jgi:hypothetical protein
MKRMLAFAAAAVVAVAACQSSASPGPTSPGSATPSGANATPTPASTASAPGSPGPSVAPPTTATVGSWKQAASPDMAKFNAFEFNAVPIAGDRVLVISDANDELSAETAQVWDAKTDAWHPVEPLPKERGNFVAVPLADGRALVTGGVNESRQSYSSSYIFDPATESWTKTGLLGTARTNATGVLLKNGRVLVVGGYYQNGKGPGDAMGGVMLAAWHPGLADIDVPVFANALATAEIYDPATGTWSPTGPMVYARNGAQAVTLSDGRVLVFGSAAPWNTGVQVDTATFESAEIYDPATGKFSLAGTLPPIDRAALQAAGKPGSNPIPEEAPDPGFGQFVATADGSAYLMGVAQSWKHVGDITRSCSFRNGTWTELPGTFVYIGEPTEKVLYTPDVPDNNGVTASLLPDGRILVAGGLGPTTPVQQEGFTSYDNPMTADARFFDPGSNAWSSAPAMPGPRQSGQALTLQDGSAFVLGGNTEIDEGNSGPAVVRYLP